MTWFLISSYGHSEQEYCKLHHSCETNATYLASCGHPPHFKHPHEECYAGYPNNYNDYLKNLNLLSCLNRMDKKDSMFTQNIFQRRTPAKKLSTLLNYTEDYFVCRNTTYDWTIATFENIVNVWPMKPYLTKLKLSNSSKTALVFPTGSVLLQMWLVRWKWNWYTSFGQENDHGPIF